MYKAENTFRQASTREHQQSVQPKNKTRTKSTRPVLAIELIATLERRVSTDARASYAIGQEPSSDC